MGNNAKLKEQQKWSNEKLHLQNAQKLRGIFFIDPEDKEFKETHQLLLLFLAKLWRRIVGVVHPTKLKQDLRVFEADESTRLRMGNSLPNHHENHVAGKSENSLQHYKQWKVLQWKQQWTRNGKSWRKFRRGTWQKSKVRNKWSMKQGRRALQFILHH